MTPGSVVPIHTKPRPDERLKVALDAMPVAVAWTRLNDGRVEFMNQRFIELFGYYPHEKTDVYELITAMFADPQHAQAAIGGLRSFIGSNVLERFNFPTQEVLAVRSDGTTITTIFSGVILPEANLSVATFVDISDVKEREQYYARLATEDTLTGLKNRRAFDVDLAQSITGSIAPEGFALLMLDLDGFKAANDTAGHDAGDAILVKFAQSLRQSVRASDVACRWGGDEFAVLLRSPCLGDTIHTVVSRIKQSVEKPFELDGRAVKIGVSVGYARYPGDGLTASDLYRCADQAMYVAKKARVPGGQSGSAGDGTPD